jgi:hypothetical protein
MGPKKQRTVTVNADVTTAMNYARQAILQCGWKVSKIDGVVIKVQTGISFTSWGETILIQIRTINNQTMLNVSSEFVWGLIDIMGTNQKNVNKYLTALSRLVQIA